MTVASLRWRAPRGMPCPTPVARGGAPLCNGMITALAMVALCVALVPNHGRLGVSQGARAPSSKGMKHYGKSHYRRAVRHCCVSHHRIHAPVAMYHGIVTTLHFIALMPIITAALLLMPRIIEWKRK